MPKEEQSLRVASHCLWSAWRTIRGYCLEISFCVSKRERKRGEEGVRERKRKRKREQRKVRKKKRLFWCLYICVIHSYNYDDYFYSVAEEGLGLKRMEVVFLSLVYLFFLHVIFLYCSFIKSKFYISSSSYFICIVPVVPRLLFNSASYILCFYLNTCDFCSFPRLESVYYSLLYVVSQSLTFQMSPKMENIFFYVTNRRLYAIRRANG